MGWTAIDLKTVVLINAVMAVGAGHLGGKGSVQDQLVKAGIPTSRVQ